MGEGAERVTAANVRLTYVVKQLERAIRSEMDVMARRFGLTAVQYTALSVLQRHPGMSSAQLARRSFVTAQAGSEMIAVLERKDLIRRAPDEHNRRILRASLTSAGEAVLAGCDAEMRGLEARMLTSFTSDDAASLQAALWACVCALRPGPTGASPD